VLDPLVTASSAASPVGSRPVGIARHLLTVDANWQVPRLRGVSLDAALSQRGTVAATLDNRVMVPPRAQLDVGGRYRFRLAKLNAVARVQVANLFAARGFAVQGPGVYFPNAGRAASAYLAVDL
jgi:iron complex outermembrane receptor protein